ncbi:excalibur calcium-binding domain-containing protein [Deinococcus depolymerans]|uniref:Excalibur calcium-binding domain-containing protein n=1 Tax=Deinococcus depolymerans TaxID=392408 RepID=A0ABN1BT03_9DEIO
MRAPSRWFSLRFPLTPGRWGRGRAAFLRGLLAGLLCGLTVAGAAPAQSPFQIELRLLGRPLTAGQQATVREAARQVSGLIASPFVPVRVNIPAGDCDRRLPAVQGTVRNLIVFVVVRDLGDDVYATGMPCDLQDRTYLPIYGVVDLNSRGLTDLPRVDLLDTMLHELLHVLGVGTLWEADSRVSRNGETDGRSFIRRDGRSLVYTAPRAVAAYRALGGRGRGIPLDPDGGHWDGRAVCAEILSGSAGNFTGRVNPVSPVTLAALEDLGYRVNLLAASRYALPRGSCAAQLRDGSGPLWVPTGGFAGCAAARSAGATLPLRRGEPAYRPELDGDGDGLACEGGR